MNVLIIDSGKINVESANRIGKYVIEASGTDDWIMLPKGIDILQDVPIEWMKHLRSQLDEKIKALEGQV